MSAVDAFHGMNPERLAMLQRGDVPPAQESTGRFRGGGGGGRRGGGVRGRGFRGAYTNGNGNSRGGIVSSAPLPAGEQLSGLDQRMEFKKKSERLADPVTVVAAPPDQKKRKRDDEDASTGSVESTRKSKQSRKSKAKDPAPRSVPTEGEGKDKKHTEAPLSNGDKPVDELKLAKRERKAAKAAKKAQRAAKKAAKEAKLGESARETQAIEVIPVGGERESKSPKSRSKRGKKDKKEKRNGTELDSGSTKPKKSKKSKRTEDPQAALESAASKWSAVAADLPGDDKRKSKFLRLLGAGAEAVAPTTNGTEINSLNRDRDLEKQFETGLKMKREKRKGLCA